MSDAEQMTTLDLEDGDAMKLYGQTLAAAFRYHKRTKGAGTAYSAIPIRLDGADYSLYLELHEVSAR